MRENICKPIQHASGQLKPQAIRSPQIQGQPQQRVIGVYTHRAHQRQGVSICPQQNVLPVVQWHASKALLQTTGPSTSLGRSFKQFDLPPRLRGRYRTG